jgi:hypothetical protein
VKGQARWWESVACKSLVIAVMRYVLYMMMSPGIVVLWQSTTVGAVCNLAEQQRSWLAVWQMTSSDSAATMQGPGTSD